MIKYKQFLVTLHYSDMQYAFLVYLYAFEYTVK